MAVDMAPRGLQNPKSAHVQTVPIHLLDAWSTAFPAGGSVVCAPPDSTHTRQAVSDTRSLLLPTNKNREFEEWEVLPTQGLEAALR